jgi:2'-5' RNA ligase
LFVAVDLPDAVRQSAAIAAARVRDALAHVPARSRLAWVEPTLLHLTLVFLGEVDDSTGNVVLERMRAPLAVAPFTLGLGQPGMFPPYGRPRVLWLAVTDGAPALVEAQAAVTRRLEGIRYRREERAFAPHLTLARFKEGGTDGERRAIEQVGVAAASGAVDHVTLYRSRLTPRGPEYTVLVKSTLGGDVGA